jgi:flagellar assembly factor FliW
MSRRFRGDEDFRRSNVETGKMATNNIAERLAEDPMEIDTRYGRQQVSESSLLTFPGGIPGFESLEQFKLFHEEDGANLHFLQSTTDAEVRLPVITPDACKIDFRIELTDEECEKLEIEAGDDLLILLSLSEDEREVGPGVRVNLMGPIIVNARSRKGIQKILNKVDGAVVIEAS